MSFKGMMVSERRGAGAGSGSTAPAWNVHVLVAHVVALGPEPIRGGVHVQPHPRAQRVLGPQLSRERPPRHDAPGPGERNLPLAPRSAVASPGRIGA